MLYDKKIENILFLDIETVSQHKTFADADDRCKYLWDKKSKFLREEDETAEDVYGKAGIYAEFGKIICISAGFLNIKGSETHFRLKSFYGDDEKKLLEDFSEMLIKFSTKGDKQLCAHNGKEFDFPWIARRMLINGLKLPTILNTAGKKPWEVDHLDTMELWKFGDYKHYTSLELLTSVFNIPTPKDDIDGSQVGGVYWIENDLDRIVEYCQKDVLAIAQLLLKYKGMDLIDDNNVEITD